MAHRIRFFPLVVVVIFLPVFGASASEGKHEPMMKKDEHQGTSAAKRELHTLEDLKAEVEALRKAVEALQALSPTLTTIMPNFAERFHIMHYAGDVGDWAVAAHELAELQRFLRVAAIIDPNKGALMKGFMTKNFNDLNAAIEHGNREAFDKVLKETINNCNACHAAVGSEFIKVTLDTAESLSIRHAHRFVRSRKSGAHMHKH
jgi:cytochrome c556